MQFHKTTPTVKLPSMGVVQLYGRFCETMSYSGWFRETIPRWDLVCRPIICHTIAFHWSIGIFYFFLRNPSIIFASETKGTPGFALLCPKLPVACRGTVITGAIIIICKFSYDTCMILTKRAENNLIQLGLNPRSLTCENCSFTYTELVLARPLWVALMC